MKKRILGILLALCMVFALLPATAGAANVLYSGTCGDNATCVITDDGVMTISGTGTVTELPDLDAKKEYWPSVKTINVCEGITTISSWGLVGFPNAETLNLPDSLQTLDDRACCWNSSLKEIHFGSGLVTIGGYTFASNKNMVSIDLPDSVESIGVGAFEVCSSLKSVVIPGSVKTIWGSAFYNCTSLEEVVLMDGIETLKPGVFTGCDHLESIYLPDTIQSIGASAFNNCSALTEVRLPAQTPEIPEKLFFNCSSLEYVIIPNTVQMINKQAFDGCTNLSALYYAGTEEQLGKLMVDPEGNDVLADVDVYLIPSMPDPVFYLYDMPARDNWAYPGIAFCLSTGLMKGVSDGYFQPDGFTTRGQLVTILWRLMGEPKAENPATFSDLTQDWYRDAVAWAAENDITKGTSDTTFSPDALVTREQMVTIFYRMCRDYLEFDMSPSASLDRFPDNGEVSEWAVEALQWGIAVKLINGASDGSGVEHLLPQGNATRAQIATVMLNFVNAFEDSLPEE